MAFWELLGEVVTLGIGAAFTPSLLALQILIVSRDPWQRRSIAVILGAATAFILVGLLFFFGFARVHSGGLLPDGTLGAALRLIAGLLLWGFAAWMFIPHPALRQRVEADIQSYVARASVFLFFGVAFLLSIKDVSSFIMLIPALHDIASSGEPMVVNGLLLVLLYALALSPVLVPPALRWIFGHRVDRFFHAVYRFTMDHQFPIVGAICAIIGLYLVVSGVLEFMRSM